MTRELSSYPSWSSPGGEARLYLGDCIEVMREMDADSFDSIVTDPPYGLSFMGKDWDSFKAGDIAMRRNPQMDAVNTGASRQGGRQRACADYQKRQARDMLAFQEAMQSVFAEALRVAKPGAHLLAFGGTRTFHRLAVAIEDAGWEIRDCVMWVYGQGFPKSLDVSKAIDKAAGAEREVVGVNEDRARRQPNGLDTAGRNSYQLAEVPYVGNCNITAPATDAARQWQGFGTALKPAFEPVIVARKPIVGTVAENVQRFGTGAMNIDGCRIVTNPEVDDPRLGGNGTWGTKNAAKNIYEGGYAGEQVSSSPLGRFPANIIHDGSDEVVALFPESDGQQGDLNATGRPRPSSGRFGDMGPPAAHPARCDSGSAARFFYCAKASKEDRDEGCCRNNHPTVKPTDLMRYLCRLVTPPNGLVLDPFCGSGSTGKAAAMERFRFAGIELDPAYFAIAKNRIAAALGHETVGKDGLVQRRLWNGEGA